MFGSAEAADVITFLFRVSDAPPPSIPMVACCPHRWTERVDLFHNPAWSSTALTPVKTTTKWGQLSVLSTANIDIVNGC